MRYTILAGVAMLALSIPATAQDAPTTTDTQAPAATAAGTLTAEQQAQFDSWPADRQTAYNAWPADVQAYYWTLTPQQVQGWWALTDEQRVQVDRMTPEQRATAWASINAQLAGAPPPAATPPAAAPASAAPTGTSAAMGAETTTAPSAPAAAAPTSTSTAMGTDTTTAAPAPADPAMGTSTTMGTTAAAGMGTMGSTTSTTASGNMRFVRGEVTQNAPAATPGTEYPPCRGEVQDGCVNPREAGLNYGNRPLNYWPGRPASESDAETPANPPA